MTSSEAKYSMNNKGPRKDPVNIGGLTSVVVLECKTLTT